MGRFEENRLFVLNDPSAPRLCPSLAAEIGLNESILFLQLEFWIAIMGKQKDGRLFVYKSVRDLTKSFPFWSSSTINRAIQSLINKDLIITANYNTAKYDRTRWFSINIETASALKSIAIKGSLLPGDDTHPNQNGTPSRQDATHSTQDETTIQENCFETPIRHSSSSSSCCESETDVKPQYWRGWETRKGKTTFTEAFGEYQGQGIDDFLESVSEEAWMRVKEWAPGYDRDEVNVAAVKWELDRRASGARSADWLSDWMRYVIKWFENLDQPLE